jgi:Cation/multidrug efflux pump
MIWQVQETRLRYASLGKTGPQFDLSLKPLKAKLKNVHGLVDLALTSQDSAPQFDIKVDPLRAGRLLLTPLDVTDQVKAAFLGQVATQMRQGDKFVDVRVRLPDKIRFNPSMVGQLQILGKNGAILPLDAIATISQINGRS